MHLKDQVPIVLNDGRIVVFSRLAGELRGYSARIWEVYVLVEARHQQFFDFVLGFTHHMRVSAACLEVRGPITDDKVLSRDENCHLTTQRGVKIDFFERRTRQRKAPEHSFVLCTVLRHLFRQLVVHVILDTRRRLLFFLR